MLIKFVVPMPCMNELSQPWQKLYLMCSSVIEVFVAILCWGVGYACLNLSRFNGQISNLITRKDPVQHFIACIMVDIALNCCVVCLSEKISSNLIQQVYNIIVHALLCLIWWVLNAGIRVRGGARLLLYTCVQACAAETCPAQWVTLHKPVL